MDLVVDFAALDEAEAAMRATVERVSDLLADLAAFLAPMSAGWSGAAGDAYRGRQRQWDAAASDLVVSLSDLHGLMVSAHRNHAAAVRANSAIWRV